VVTVPDGHTVVIGGLAIESESDASSRVPLLGSIPVVKHLFQNRSRSKSLNRFFVFLRCSVMRAETFEDLRYVSAADIEVAGVDDGWPVLEPRIIR
jgi:type II secretory pathway component GspD/PulD (secretin)